MSSKNNNNRRRIAVEVENYTKAYGCVTTKDVAHDLDAEIHSWKIIGKTQYQMVEPTANMLSLTSPHSSNCLAQDSKVEPVVKISSTSKMCFPRN
ncbi:MAG: hypothetical protein H6Q14_1798 [Bacteroidetes bacterium]|jgi:hypothetical protein|nr:hypothetical protein [Bacteroidota bacterium]